MSVGVDGRQALEGMLSGAQRQSRAWQAEQIRRTGFATPHDALGHEVIAVLRGKGYPVTVANVAGHLAAVGSAYNWQGCARIGELVGRSERTVQRARARLEADGLIRSHLLLTGDMVDGQRAPVWHPQVVRDVSRLQRLATVHATVRRTEPPRRGGRKSRPRQTVAHVPPRRPPEKPVEPMTPDDHRRLAQQHPEWARHHEIIAAALQRPTPPTDDNTIEADELFDPATIDEWDKETTELERELDERRQRARAPPKRGPPE